MLERRAPAGGGSRLAPALLLLSLAVGAPPAAAQMAVVPFVECVERLTPDTLSASFGYDNPNDETLTAFIGLNNRFRLLPSDALDPDQGQPTSFLPGIHPNVVTVEYPDSETLTWRLTGITATADFNDQPCFNKDYGDAPASYPVLLDDDGARHTNSLLALGPARDTEPDGQPSALADGDDSSDGSDDEDGVSFGGPFGGGVTTLVTVTVSGPAALLDAWLDFNADGDWDDAGEQVFASQPVNPGANVLGVAVPAGAAVGDTFVRFRLSTAGALEPGGLAHDGEVEDYALTLDDGTTDTDGDGIPDVYEDNTPGLDADDASDGDERTRTTTASTTISSSWPARISTIRTPTTTASGTPSTITRRSFRTSATARRKQLWMG